MKRAFFRIGTKLQIKDLNNEAKSSFVDEEFIENLMGSIPVYKELKHYMRNALEESLPKISYNDFAT